MRWESSFNVIHADTTWSVGALPKQSVDKHLIQMNVYYMFRDCLFSIIIVEYLKEIAGKVVGSFRIRTGDFVQWTFLSNRVERIDFANVVRCPSPNNKEIRRGQVMLVDWRTIHVVFNGLDRLARMESTQKR